MRIGLVLDDTLDTPDGVQQYVLTTGSWLQSQGHEVHYLVGQTARTDVANIHSLSRNVQVTYNGNRLSIPLPANRRRLKEALDGLRLDVMHVQVPYSPFLAGRLLRLISPQTAVIGTFHILPYSGLVRLTNHGLALLNRRSSRRFDHMLAVSAPAADFARRVYGYDTTVVPNPFNLSQFQVVPVLTAVPTIVFLGRLVARKGALQLVRAVAQLRQAQLYNGELRVIIGGKGALLAELQTAVHQMGLGDIVSFPGFIAEADKAQFLAQADLAVFPSTAGESFGISLLEAMAAVPGVVLGGDNLGYRSVLAPLGENRLINPLDTAKFAQQLAWWLQNSAARTQAANEQKRYVSQYDITVVGKRLEYIYEQALQSRPRS